MCNKNKGSIVTCVTIVPDDTHRIFYCDALFGSFCYNCQHINVSNWNCTCKKIYKCIPTATKHALYANFTYMPEKVILLGRSRLRPLVMLVCAHDMQIHVGHAVCKQCCRLISHTANKRFVTIEACYNCPRSPLYIWARLTKTTIKVFNF